MSDLDEQWEGLCQEWNEANEKFLASFARVNRHFFAVANDPSVANSVLKELDEQSEAWEQLEDIKQRMSEFVRENA